ncbi:alpha/beta hydrolase [Eisenibacter elegans]|uniref:alpha/beta hydrolase n=1 Tax=Eisenibacter elegans TaxID=997 RepID=UPI00040E1F5D|nr:alpha/beta hydrolase [Eisenibacter elegans]
MASLPFKLRLLLWATALRPVPPMHKVSVEKFRNYNRKSLEQLDKLVQYPPMEMHRVEDVSIPTADGTPIKARLYTPVKSVEPLPLMLFFHGGGYVIGSVESHDKQCRRLAAKAGCLVLSVDYRLAPEYRFPTAPEDCYAALCWAYEHIAAYGGDPQRLATCGDSAGGNLATVVAMMSRDRKGPTICQQVLIYPVTDATMSFPSIKTNAKGYLLSQEMMEWFLNHYRDPKTDLKDPYLSPYWASDHSQLPPAYIATAGYDPLHDEGEAYAQKLRDAGVPVQYRSFKNMVHVFFQLPKLLKECRELEDDIAKVLQAAFSAKVLS